MLIISIFTGLVLFIAAIGLRLWLRRKREWIKSAREEVTVGIFHPYCNAGGGGERVLWAAVKCLQANYKNSNIVVYTGDTITPKAEILAKVKRTFDIAIEPNAVDFIFLKLRRWVEAERYPYFTLLGQSIGSMILGLEALFTYPPDVYIDTMGYAFTYPLFRYLSGSKVGCYTHYPVISCDMLNQVHRRIYSHNNKNYIARNPFLSQMKLIYYRLFSKLYRWVGQCSDTVMVNSSWTEGHILQLWQVPSKTHRVYPPCEVDDLKNLQKSKSEAEILIVSIGQFRPEKDHPLQIQALYELRNILTNDEETWNKVRLLIVGSCRNENDCERLKNLQDLTKHFSLENSVEFKTNVSYSELIEIYRRADIGLHTMWNEHFGIGVVECMAAALITIAHRSGGPLMDIVETSEGSRTGYLATDANEYAHCIMEIITATDDEKNTIRSAARSSVDRFSQKEFEVNFSRAVSPLFKNCSSTNE